MVSTGNRDIACAQALIVVRFWSAYDVSLHREGERQNQYDFGGDELLYGDFNRSRVSLN
jgi:putative NADH-flavin reductase